MLGRQEYGDSEGDSEDEEEQSGSKRARKSGQSPRLQVSRWFPPFFVASESPPECRASAADTAKTEALTGSHTV